MKTMRLFLCFACLGPALLVPFGSARAESLSGRVEGESMVPLGGVAVSIPALKRGATTDDSGAYVIDGIPHGVYAVMFSLIGYAPVTRTVHVHEAARLDVSLSVRALEGDVITVTGAAQAQALKFSSQATSTVEERELERRRGPALFAALDATPGVSLYSTGQGIAKPVVRGLTSQRVLVLSDGIRQEGQQWGDEHGPELSSMGAARIEVVRGPGSVLYGSDALGGVVNVLSPDIPSRERGSPALHGEFTGDLATNGPGAAGSVQLEGAQHHVGYRANASVRTSGDLRTPETTLRNSSLEEHAGGAALGFSGRSGSLDFGYAGYDSRLEIHEDPAEDPSATPYQSVVHHRVRSHGQVPAGPMRFDLEAAWQENRRREFEAEAEPEPELELRLRTTTVQGRVHHHPVEALTGTAGVAFMSQTNTSLAEEKLIPDYDLVDVAFYLFETLHLGTATLSAGARLDERTLDVAASLPLGVPAQARDYSAFTAQGGFTLRLAEPVSLLASVGRAWRAPTPFELFVDGVHEGTVRYEIGDPTLSPEASLNLDIGLRAASERFKLELAAYRNAIDRYIYLQPTGATDSTSGFDVYRHTQADAVIVGVEVATQWKLASAWQLRGGLDLARGTNRATEGALPLMPAAVARLGAQLAPARWGPLASPYAAADLEIVAEQKRVDVFESPSTGYVLLDLSAGMEWPMASGRLRVDLRLSNALDQRFRNHLNRYKAYADDPGRAVSLKLSVPFLLLS